MSAVLTVSLSEGAREEASWMMLARSHVDVGSIATKETLDLVQEVAHRGGSSTASNSTTNAASRGAARGRLNGDSALETLKLSFTSEQAADLCDEVRFW